MHNDEFFMRRAIALSKSAVAHGNEPFGAVLVKDGEIVLKTKIKFIPATIPASTAKRVSFGSSAPKRASPICTSTPCTPAASPASCAAALWCG